MIKWDNESDIFLIIADSIKHFNGIKFLNLFYVNTETHF